MRDEWFIRGDVPMTKSEVRAISLSKLELTGQAVLLDIGAGTGSVSVEAACCHPVSRIFAFERSGEALELLRKNREKAGDPGRKITVISGTAPDSFPDPFPVLPTHAFIGGSSGNMEPLIKRLLVINPEMRVVVNAIALETLSEITGVTKKLGIRAELTSVQIARAREAGNYHLMEGMNPVWVISFGGVVRG